MTGTIRRITNKGPSDPFIARMWLQIVQIRDNAFPKFRDPERQKFDEAYKPIRNNLEQCKAAYDEIRILWNRHAASVVDREISRFDGQTIHVDQTIDNELERKVKEFFNRGKNAIEQLDKLEPWMGFVLKPFNKTDKDFENSKAKLLTSATGEDRKWFEKVIYFIETQRKGWLSDFTRTRNRIEHEAWHLEEVRYGLLPDDRIRPIMPEIEGNQLDLVLNTFWDNLFEFCETMVVEVALGRYIKPPRKLMQIRIEDRQPDNPIRYYVDIDEGTEVHKSS